MKNTGQGDRGHRGLLRVPGHAAALARGVLREGRQRQDAAGEPVLVVELLVQAAERSHREPERKGFDQDKKRRFHGLLIPTKDELF